MERSLSVAIMVHPARLDRYKKDLEPKIVESLNECDGFVSRYAVVLDDANNLWDTACGAWLSHDPCATHHLVLQDDILIYPHLFLALKEMLPLLPAIDSISLCSTLKSIDYMLSKSRYSGYCWQRSNIVRNGQALIQPVHQIRDWIAWSLYHVRDTYRYDDGRLDMYLKHVDKYIWHAIPSLVEHDDNGSIHKTEDTRDIPYKATRYIGNKQHTDFDWSVGVDNPFTIKENACRPLEKWALGDHKISINQVPLHAIDSNEAFSENYLDSVARSRKLLHYWLYEWSGNCIKGKVDDENKTEEA